MEHVLRKGHAVLCHDDFWTDHSGKCLQPQGVLRLKCDTTVRTRSHTSQPRTHSGAGLNIIYFISKALKPYPFADLYRLLCYYR